MTYADFLQLLEEKGKPTERKVVEILKKYDNETYQVEGYDPGKDIVCPLIRRSFEVKSQVDAIACVSVEVADDRNGRHKESGISTTTATHWVYFCKDQYFFISTTKLKELVEDKEIKKFHLFEAEVSMKILNIERELRPNCNVIFNEQLERIK